jgi:L-ribulokinase
VAIVAGVDFGTLSVRVTLLDSDPENGKPDKSGKPRGRLGTATAEYPLHRRRDDPDYATQSHDDQMDALVKAMRTVLEQTAVRGGDVVALALDTTGSSVVPVDA